MVTVTANKETRRRFFSALRKLRKQGLLVHPNCPESYRYERDLQDNPTAEGAVWTYRDQREERGEPLTVWLSYAGQDILDTEVGKMIQTALKEAGLAGITRWNGNPTDCILVNEKPTEEGGA